MTWSKAPVDPEEVRRVAARYKCGNLAATILLRRSVAAPRDASYFLEDDLSLLNNPFLMDGMEAAVERIRRAVAASERVFVFGDRDVDGVSSVVLLSDALRASGLTVDCDMPEGDDEYGLTEKWVRRISESGASLVITVDCGISSRREIALAAELGLDCIVTDHHNAPEEIPECVAVLDPKIPGSGYPFRELSGCGVAWKLDWALAFSRAPDYGRERCLLVTRPANDALAVDAVRMRNLRVVDTLSETLIPGMVRYRGSRLERFVGETPALVWDRDEVAASLGRVFDGPVDLALEELKGEVGAAFPALADKSLLRILEASRAARYGTRPPREIETLADLHAALGLERARSFLAPTVARLDLVALGTLSDLMTLRDENRLLVRAGMASLSGAPRSGLRELLASLDLLGKPLTTRDVAWRVTPVLNAAGRMGQPRAALDLFLSDGMQRAAERAEGLIELNRRRKALGDKVWDECRSDATASLEKTGGKILLVSGPRIHWGITGILAARLAGAFKAPAVVVAEQAERCIGSVRSPVGFSLVGFLDRFADLLAGYGGHDFAAGFSLPAEHLEAFRGRFYEVAEDVEMRPASEETLTIDAEIPAALLVPSIAETVDRFEPYGEGNPPLTFLTRGLVVESIDLIGRSGGADGAPHGRLLLAAATHRWPAVYWNGAGRIREKLTLHQRVDVVYRVERNRYMGMDNLRLNILDIGP
jgi:single-stranded-DNA-specific exonuclease